MGVTHSTKEAALALGLRFVGGRPIVNTCELDVGQNPVPPVNLKVDGHPEKTTWLVGFDPYPIPKIIIKSQ